MSTNTCSLCKQVLILICYCYLADQGVIFLQPLEMPVEIPEDSNGSEDDMKLVLASRRGKLKSATFESR